MAADIEGTKKFKWVLNAILRSLLSFFGEQDMSAYTVSGPPAPPLPGLPPGAEDEEIPTYDVDDRGVGCFEFEDGGWVSVVDRDLATPAQILAIEKHPEFTGWEERCEGCLSSLAGCECGSDAGASEGDGDDEDDDDARSEGAEGVVGEGGKKRGCGDKCVCGSRSDGNVCCNCRVATFCEGCGDDESCCYGEDGPWHESEREHHWLCFQCSMLSPKRHPVSSAPRPDGEFISAFSTMTFATLGFSGSGSASSAEVSPAAAASAAAADEPVAVATPAAAVAPSPAAVESAAFGASAADASTAVVIEKAPS